MGGNVQQSVGGANSLVVGGLSPEQHARERAQAAAREFAFQPLTYQRFLRLHLDKEERGDHSPLFVQARRKGVTFCGRVLDVAPGDEVDFVKLELRIAGTGMGMGWVVSKNVRLCNFDGRCACAGGAADGDGAADGCGGASRVTPLGNTGGTVVEGGTL